VIRHEESVLSFSGKFPAGWPSPARIAGAPGPKTLSDIQVARTVLPWGRHLPLQKRGSRTWCSEGHRPASVYSLSFRSWRFSFLIERPIRRPLWNHRSARLVAGSREPARGRSSRPRDMNQRSLVWRGMVSFGHTHLTRRSAWRMCRRCQKLVKKPLLVLAVRAPHRLVAEGSRTASPAIHGSAASHAQAGEQMPERPQKKRAYWCRVGTERARILPATSPRTTFRVRIRARPVFKGAIGKYMATLSRRYVFERAFPGLAGIQARMARTAAESVQGGAHSARSGKAFLVATRRSGSARGVREGPLSPGGVPGKAFNRPSLRFSAAGDRQRCSSAAPRSRRELRKHYRSHLASPLWWWSRLWWWSPLFLHTPRYTTAKPVDRQAGHIRIVPIPSWLRLIGRHFATHRE